MRKVWLALSLAGMIVAFGTGMVVAGGGGRPGEVGIAGGSVTVKGIQGGCGMAARTAVNQFEPNDGDEEDLDNAALQVTFKKKCSGPVIAQFQTEIETDTGGEIHAAAYARCIGPGGLPNGCSAGTERQAAPGTTFLQNNDPTQPETHGMNFVFDQLPPGNWQYRIGVGENGAGNSNVEYRSLVVEAFQRP